MCVCGRAGRALFWVDEKDVFCLVRIWVDQWSTRGIPFIVEETPCLANNPLDRPVVLKASFKGLDETKETKDYDKELWSLEW